MSDYRTSRRRLVQHCHITPCFDRELNSTEIIQRRDWVMENFPGVTILLPATRQYNCHGKAHANSHGWFNDPQLFIEDDYIQETMAHPQIDDIIVYKNIAGQHTHSAIVTQVIGTTITQCKSKWGESPELLHGLNEVPSDYGSPIYCLRRRSGTFQILSSTEMNKIEFKDEFDKIRNPDNYIKIGLASSPEIARTIISNLDGVDALANNGDALKNRLIELFNSDEVKNNDYLMAIILYLIQRNPFPEFQVPLAEMLIKSKLNFLLQEMLPSAFLSTIGIIPSSKSLLNIAISEAMKLLNSKNEK